MKFLITRYSWILIMHFLLTSCGGNPSGENDISHQHDDDEAHQEETGDVVHLSAAQFSGLDMAVDQMPSKNMVSMVQANGELEVPPQNEATVTAILGANVSSIRVIEGDEVQRGQVLIYLSHPNLTRLQSDYLEAFNQLRFLEQEFQRQKRLYEEEVGSGKTFQQTQADYQSVRVSVKSLGSQLRQLGMDEERIQEGEFYDVVPVTSPIEGSVGKVYIKTGQYVPPEKELLEIINTDHIHADLMVFEKDVYKVREGQRIRFTVETLPGNEMFARIYAVGKKFEQDPKAVHIHAEIENKKGILIPGMYIRGQILTDSAETKALPEGAIIRDGERYYAFLAEKKAEGDDQEWMFSPVEVRTGITGNGWVAVTLLQEIPEESLFAMNNAYYLLAEMRKGEGGHDH